MKYNSGARVPMTTPPMPRPHPDFSPSQRIHPKMIGSQADNFDFPAQDPSQDPKERNNKSFFLFGWQAQPTTYSRFPNHDVNLLCCCSRCCLPSQAPQCKRSHQGAAQLSASSASLSLPSNRPPHHRCPPGLTQAVDDALTPPTPPRCSTLQPSGHPLLIHRSSWIVAFTSLVLPRQTFQCGSMTAA